MGGGSDAVLVYNAASASERVHEIQDGAGMHYVRIQHRVGPPPAPLLPHPLIIGWYTCEANLHHFLLETMSALVNGLSRWGLLPADPATLPTADVWTFVCSDGAFMFGEGEPGCHGPRYLPLLHLLPVNPPTANQCVAWGAGVAHPIGEHPLVCYEHALITRPIYGAVSRHVETMRFLANAARSRGWCTRENSQLAWNRSDSVHVVVLDRALRRLLDPEALVTAIASAFPAAEARLFRPDGFSPERQLGEMACFVDIIVGVHGAGLQWAGLLGEAASPPRRSGLLEVTTSSWGRFYSKGCYNDVSTDARLTAYLEDEEGVPNEASFRARNGDTAPGKPMGPPWDPRVVKKWSDVRVRSLDVFLREVGVLVAWVAGDGRTRDGNCTAGDNCTTSNG